MLRFIKQQIVIITSSKSRFSVLIRKAGLLFLILLSLPIVIAVRALRPLVHIRFGSLVGVRMGHLASNTELYLCRRDAGMYEGMVDLFSCDRPVANKQLLKMFGRLLHIRDIYYILYRANHLLPGYRYHEVPVRGRVVGDNSDFDDILIKSGPHISFTEEETSLGINAMKEMGIPEGSPFICFHTRDSAYLEKMLPGKDWNYWNYRDSSIYSQIPAIEWLVNRGYFAVRMGYIVKERLHGRNQMIIDYASKFRTDFMDMYLLANCKFLIGTMTGLTNTTYELFRKPLVWVNIVPIMFMHFWCANSLFITKKLWCKKEHRFLKFREMADAYPPILARTEVFKENSIEVIDNSPEEITAITIEMDNRLKGTWETTEEDEYFQKRFRDIILESEFPGKKIRARVGAEFLRQNKELLD